MNVYISCDDKAIATRLRTALSKLGIECGHANVLSHDSALALAGNQLPATTLLFFCILDLIPDNLDTLKRLASGARLKVIAVGQRLTPSAILQAVRAGAVDGINLDESLEIELPRLIERLQATTDRAMQHGRLISVVTPLGGAGATMIATNLAAAIARREGKCCLLDLHWRGGDAASFLNSEPRHNLLSLASKCEQLDRTMFEQSLVRHSSGIDLLASPEPYSDFRQIRPELIQKIVQIARLTYSTVIADLEDCEHVDQEKALAASDKIIVPLRADLISLIRIKKFLAFLSASGVPRDHVILVANRIGLPKELTLAQINEVLGVPVPHQVPDDAASLNEAINLGVALIEAHPKSRAAASLNNLAQSICRSETEEAKEPVPAQHWLRSVITGPNSIKCLARFIGTEVS